MFRRFGSEVTVIELNDQIVPREDPEISQSLREALEEEGVNFRLGENHQDRQDAGRRGGNDREQRWYQRDAQRLAPASLCRPDAEFG